MGNPNLKNRINRLHVNAGYKWAFEVGTDYWMHPSEGLNQGAASASTSLEGLLVGGGWIATALTTVGGVSADFRGGVFTPGSDKGRGGSYVDAGTPTHFITNADNDLLESPAIFGDAVHMQAVAAIAGQANLPTILGVSFWGAMSVASANAKEASWGFWQDGGDALVPGEAIASIYSNSVNFALQVANADVGSVGSLINTNWHYWNIELDFGGFISWSIDGVLQQRNTVAIQTDKFPCSFGFASDATNFPALSGTHVYYGWGTGRG